MAWKQRVIRDLPCRPKWIHNNHHDIMSTVTIKRVVHGLVSITSELWKEPWAEFDTTDTLWVIEVSSTTVSGTMEVVLSPGLLSLLMMKWWDSYPRNHHRKKNPHLIKLCQWTNSQTYGHIDKICMVSKEVKLITWRNRKKILICLIQKVYKNRTKSNTVESGVRWVNFSTTWWRNTLGFCEKAFFSKLNFHINFRAISN